jgi:putative ABC transport system permease protein
MVELQPRRPRKRYVIFTALAVLVLAGFAVLLAYDRRVALIYVATAAAVFYSCA